MRDLWQASRLLFNSSYHSSNIFIKTPKNNVHPSSTTYLFPLVLLLYNKEFLNYISYKRSHPLAKYLRLSRRLHLNNGSSYKNIKLHFQSIGCSTILIVNSERFWVRTSFLCTQYLHTDAKKQSQCESTLVLWVPWHEKLWKLIDSFCCTYW